MADRLDKQTRLSPPLMHVFRAAHVAKDAKKRAVAQRRLQGRQVITESDLRHEVLHDLSMLLNTVALASTVDMMDAPHVRNSILNFGIPDVTKRSIDEIGVNEIAEEIRTAIVNFEPRLASASLEVERDTSVDPAELKVRFVVRAELMCEPIHVPVEFVAEVMDSGKFVINRL